MFLYFSVNRLSPTLWVRVRTWNPSCYSNTIIDEGYLGEHRDVVRTFLLRWLVGLARLSLTALTETVAETATNHLQVTHATGASGLPPLGLHGPVVCWKHHKHKRIRLKLCTNNNAILTGTQLGSRVSALGALGLLDMVRRASAPTAQRVRLIAALSKTWGSLRLLGQKE